MRNGRLRAVAGSESHGIVGVPTYADGVGFDLETMTGWFSLAPGISGHDAGAVVPNFTDGYTGSASDIGAHETGTPPMQFGVKAGRRGIQDGKGGVGPSRRRDVVEWIVDTDLDIQL